MAGVNRPCPRLTDGDGKSSKIGVAGRYVIVRKLIQSWPNFGCIAEIARQVHSRQPLRAQMSRHGKRASHRSHLRPLKTVSDTNVFLMAQGELLEHRWLLSAEDSLTIRSGSVQLDAATSWVDKDVSQETSDSQSVDFPATDGVEKAAEVVNFYSYDTLTRARFEGQGEFFDGMTLAVQTVGQREWKTTERQPDGTTKNLTNAQRTASASARLSLNLEAEPLPGRPAMTPVWVQMDSILRPDGTDPDALGTASISFSPTIDTFAPNGLEYYLVNTGQSLTLEAETAITNGVWGGNPYRYASVSVAPTRIIRPEIRADYFWYETADADEPIGNDTINLWYSQTGLAPAQTWTLSIYWAQVTQKADGSNDVSIRDIAYRSQQTAQIGNSPGDRVNTPVSIKVQDLAAKPEGANHLFLRLDDGPVDGGIGMPLGEIVEVNENNNSALLSVIPNVIAAEPSWNSQAGGLDLNYSVTNRYWLTGNDNQIPVVLEWTGEYDYETGPATRENIVIKVDPLKLTHHVEWNQFRSPHLAGVSRISLAMKPPFEEVTDADNSKDHPLPDLSPVITKIDVHDPHTAGVIRKAEYRPSVTIRNTSPIPVQFSVGWAEEFTSIESWEPGKQVEIVDPRDGDDAVEINFIDPGEFSEPGEIITIDFGKEASLPFDGKLKRSWDWIDTDLQRLVDTTVRNLLPIYFDREGALRDAVETARTEPTEGMLAKIGKNLVGNGSLSFAATRSVPVIYTVTVTAMGNSLKNVSEQSQPEMISRSTDSAKALSYMESVLHYIAVQTVLGKYGNDFEANLTELAIQLMVKQMKPLHINAIDPPRYDYDLLIRPSDVIGDATAPAGLVNGQTRDLEWMAALVEAETVTQDRILGAIDDDETKWRVAQINNASDLSHAMLEIITRLIIRQDISQEISKTQTVARDTDVVVGRLLANGMPDWFEDTARYILDEANNVGPQVAEIASDTLRAQSLTIVGSTIEGLREAARLRPTLLGEEIQQVIPEELDQLAQRRINLTERVDAGEISANLLQEISGFVTEIRARIAASNDVDGLLDELQRGYAALLKFQMADFSIVGLQASLANLVANGLLDNATAGETNAAYEDAIIRLVAGNYEGSADLLSQIAGQMDSSGLPGLIQLAESTRFIADWIHTAAETSLPGDVNGDGMVAFDDFLILSGNFGKPGVFSEGDLDDSGTIDFADFLILSANFGQPSSSLAEAVDQAFAVKL